jgi:hypothetical protein
MHLHHSTYREYLSPVFESSTVRSSRGLVKYEIEECDNLSKRFLLLQSCREGALFKLVLYFISVGNQIK